MAGLKYWPAQVDSNLNWIAFRLKPDYVRVLAVVGGKKFDGVDPWEHCGSYLNWPDYDTLMQRVTDMLYERGIKTEWTLTGTIQQTPTAASQEDLVRRVARNMQGRMHKVFMVEMMNEYNMNDGDIPILRRMATVAYQQFPGIPISLSSPGATHACQSAISEVNNMYGGFTSANAITPHWCRAVGGHVAPNLGPEPPCPKLKYNNEPRGPGASGGAGGDIDDPALIAADYQASINAGYAGYVFHTDWGVWADHIHEDLIRDDPPRGKWGHMDDVPNSEAIALALKNLRAGINSGAVTGGTANPPSLQADVQAEMDRWPTMLTMDQCGEIINNVAWKNKDLGWGVNRKTGGSHAMRHDGALIAIDILHHKPSDHIVDCMLSAPNNDYPNMDPSASWDDQGVNPNLAAGRIWIAPIAPIAPYMLPGQAVRSASVPTVDPRYLVGEIPVGTVPQLGYYHLSLQEYTQVTDPPKSATVLCASGYNHWVAYMEGIGIYSSVGFAKATSMLLAMGPEGSIAYRPTITGTGLRVYQPKGGVDYEVTTAFVADVVVAGEGQILWREGTQLKTKNLPTAKILDGISSYPRMTLVNGRWWIGYQSTTKGMVLHPLDDPHGYLMPGGVVFDISFLESNPSVIRWAWANNPSEAEGTVSFIDINTATEPINLGPGTIVPGITVPPPVEPGFMVLTSTGTFEIVPASVEVTTLPLEVFPAYPAESGHGRLVHPILGAFDYEVKPDEWMNIDAEAIIPPVWASSRTLTSTANVLWQGHLRDVVVEERWKALGGLSMPITQLRMLLAIWTTPIDPDVGYVHWHPNYITGVAFKVLPVGLTAGGQGISFDDVVNYKDENGDPTGWMTQPVTLTLKIVERV
jgi:hypothetical protein